MSNMTRILLTSLFLLSLAVPGSAGAEEDAIKYTLEEISQDIRQVMKEFGPQLKHDRECLAKMESAMKAMEPYLLRGDGKTSVIKEWKQGLGFIAEMPLSENNVISLVEALVRWNDTKRECWAK